MEVQTLRYFLKVFSIFFIFFIFLIYFVFVREIKFKENFVLIEKNQNYKNIIDSNLEDFKINIIIYKLLFRLLLFYEPIIHYGKFEIIDKNFFNFFQIIKNPSFFYEKITIVEGTTKKELNAILKKNFDNYKEINYNELVADTYYINNNSTFNDFQKQLNKNLKLYKDIFNSNKLSKKFTFNEILVIGSFLEKEGLDADDKRKIYSVIINRLNKKMKLQIDASVIYALTEGLVKFERKLNYNDLKYKHKFNTYHIYGLPPHPISYVSGETINLIFEDYKSNYLFYFYNTLLKKHIYSKNYKEHLQKLNEYRSKK